MLVAPMIHAHTLKPVLIEDVKILVLSLELADVMLSVDLKIIELFVAVHLITKEKPQHFVKDKIYMHFHIVLLIKSVNLDLFVKKGVVLKVVETMINVHQSKLA